MILSERGHVEPGKDSGSSSSRGRRGSSASTSCRHSAATRWPHMAKQRFGEERERIEASLTAWNLRVPRLRATWDDLDHVFPRSVADLASLRLSGGNGLGNLPAAGMPWFMTVFGRDTLITCLQTLLFGPSSPAAPRGPRRAAGDRGRPVDRRRAREDRPRGPARERPRRTGSSATTARSTRRRST